LHILPRTIPGRARRSRIVFQNQSIPTDSPSAATHPAAWLEDAAKDAIEDIVHELVDDAIIGRLALHSAGDRSSDSAGRFLLDVASAASIESMLTRDTAGTSRRKDAMLHTGAGDARIPAGDGDAIAEVPPMVDMEDEASEKAGTAEASAVAAAAASAAGLMEGVLGRGGKPQDNGDER